MDSSVTSPPLGVAGTSTGPASTGPVAAEPVQPPRIDHVVIGARRVDEVAELLRDVHGFGVIRGSAHPDSTQGWLVPFAGPAVQYLEILTPADPDTLSRNAFGRAFLERTATGPAFLTWAVLSPDIDRDADRVSRLGGEDPGLLRGESVRADGRRFPWAEAGFASAWDHPGRPFFLQYGNWPARSARVPGDLERAGHRVTPQAFTGLTVRCADPGLAAWWQPYPLPVTVRPPGHGPAEGITAVRISTAGPDGAPGETTVGLP